MKKILWLESLRETLAATAPVQGVWRYYQGLSTRDQRALLVLVAVLGVLVLVFGIMFPLHNSAIEARERYQQRLQDIAWMQAHREQVRRDGTNWRDNGESLLSVVNNSARNHGLVVQRFDPMGEDGVRLAFERVEFNRAVAWLDELVSAGVRVDEFNASRRDDAGRVDLRVVLRG